MKGAITMEKNPMRYVAFYFKPWRELAERLSYEQLGKLFQATLEYADTGKEPDFGNDDTLSHCWIFERDRIERERKSLRARYERAKYAAYVRRSKRKSNPLLKLPLSFEQWLEQNCPEN